MLSLRVIWKTHNMKTVYTNKEIWKIAYPCLVSLVMEQLIGMTDTAFLGRVGEVELGASAIAAVYYMVIFMMGFGFSAGAQIIMARRNGEQNYREIGSIFYHGIYFLLGFAVVMFALSKWISPLLFECIIDNPDICAAAGSYIDWRIFGFFFSFAAAMFRAFYIGTTQTATLTLNSIVMVLSNVVFNYVLVFGKLGFPALGIVGAAIGSSLSELVSLVFFIVYTWRRIDCKKYGLNRLTRFRMRTLQNIFKVSFWTMIQNFLTFSTWFLFFLLVEHLGKEPLAVSNVARNVSSFLFMIVVAFGATCGSLVSNLIGAGKTEAVLPTIRQHIRLCYVFVLVPALLFALFPQTVISIYTNIPEIQTGAVDSLRVLCTAYLIYVPGIIYFQSVSGTGNTRMGFLLEVVVQVIYAIYCVVLIHHFRVDVAICWTSEHVYALSIFLFCWAYMRSGRWKNVRV